MGKLKAQEKRNLIRRFRDQIRGVKKAIRINQTALKILEKGLAKASHRKMQQGGGKKKGGAYEHKIAGVIAEAFSCCGVTADDCYRTKNSGAGKQKGDIQFSSALRKLLKCTIECKHVRGGRIAYNLYQRLEKMDGLFPKWWRQLEEQVKETNRPGLLIWRENRGKNLISFLVPADARPFGVTGLSYKAHMKTRIGKNDWIWTMQLSDFLSVVVKHRSKKGK